jgi:pimeloyl-ACP methyl ester carboxylesterase
VHGEREPFVSLEYIEKATWKNLWRSKVQIIPNSAHAPFVENPSQFNTILEAFLADIED